MGKPFNKELEQLPNTLEWASLLDISRLAEMIGRFHHPVYIVGSGGSFSACVYAADLLNEKGVFAKAVTPLELFYSKRTIRKSNLIFISASGRNTDILFAFKKAVEQEPISIISICMRKQTKLTALLNEYSACTSFEFTPPPGKDGFLATNSLAAYFAILFRCITSEGLQSAFLPLPDKEYEVFVDQISKDVTFVILYGAFQRSIAIDLESKFSEAGLAPSLISDYRHFAHGRHNWFDKKTNSAIIALASPSDEKLCDRTLQLLPSSIPRLVLKTNLNNYAGTIELLIQAMYLVSQFGIKQGIDPGRPGVPDYGSKIYHLRYERLVSDTSMNIKSAAIVRKAKVSIPDDLSKADYETWSAHYSAFIKKISATKFGSLIFDYDGTLCSAANRIDGMGEVIKGLLLDFVKKGFVLGIVSGRGKSLRKDLTKMFAERPDLMVNVIVGYYNGSDIAPLTNQKRPDKAKPLHASLQIVANRLKEIGIETDATPNQLTFAAQTTTDWDDLKETLLNELMLLNLDDITMVESSHSIDIIPRHIASKNNIIQHCKKFSKSLNLSTEVLCIGDKGQWPGNDYELLANEFALSVGEVSSNPSTGWNICPPGLKDEKAVEYLFGKMVMSSNHFNLKTL